MQRLGLTLREGLAISAAFALSGCATTIIPPPEPAAPASVFIVDHGRTSSLVISASDGGMLERQMEALDDSHRATEIENRPYDMTFVHHPRSYTYFWNSNHAVAAWLRELGCFSRPADRRNAMS